MQNESHAAPASAPEAPPAGARGAAAAPAASAPRRLPWTGIVLAALAALSAGALTLAFHSERRVQALEADLAKRQQDSAQVAQEARVLARQAETAAREVAARVALLDARVAETALQRSQFEDLLQSLARSRDENVLADVEAALRVAQQQSAITGSAEPLLQVLRQADERLARYAQPRLERVRRAVAQDLERTRAAGIVDISVLAIRLDELVRQVDELPLLVQPPPAAASRRGVAGSNAEAAGSAEAAGAARPAASAAAGAAAPGVPVSASASRDGEPPVLEALRQRWKHFVSHLWTETRALVRVTRIEAPEAMLLAPEQAWYLRENLKLRLLNARLALLSRQFDTAQSDLREALAAIERYFDRSARRTALAIEALRQVAAQARMVAVPRPDATLAAIAAAAAGR